MSDLEKLQQNFARHIYKKSDKKILNQKNSAKNSLQKVVI